MVKTGSKKILCGFLLFLVIGIFQISFANTHDEIILPLKFSLQGYPIVTIQIQNHSIPLIFDNGASRSSIVLNKELVKKLDLNIIPTDKVVCTGDGTGKKTCLKVYTIPEVKIGNKTMYNVPCQLMNKLWGGHYDEGFIPFAAWRNGVIGLELLNQFNVLIDYKHSQVILSNLDEYPKQYNIKNWIQTPFTNKYGITTAAKINGTPVILVWDTGANNSILRSTTKISIQETEKKSCTSINDKSCSYYFDTSIFQVGDKQLPKIRFVVQEDLFPFDGLIGSDFFKKHIIFFDFKKNIIFIEP